MRPEIRPLVCKSALSRVNGMHFRWSLSPYRGCEHACWYCYARETHTYFDLNGGRDFERIIFAKTNVAEQLGREMRSRTWKHEEVAVGTATDPYQPIEGRLRLTQACLKEFAATATPLSIITKSTMVRRDIDLLVDAATKGGVHVTVSIPIADPHLARRIEPGVPPPEARFGAVRALADAGLNVGVNLAPIIPGLTDTEGNIGAVLRLAGEHGARQVGAMVMHLKPAPRAWFMAQVRCWFPQLEAYYASVYAPGQAYAPSDLTSDIERSVDQLRMRYPLPEFTDAPIGPPPRPQQLALLI